MFQDNLRAGLSKLVETGNLVSAQELLESAADRFLTLAEDVGFESALADNYESIAERAIFMMSLVPQLLAEEAKIAEKRRTIRVLDTKILSAFDKLQEYLRICLKYAEEIISPELAESRSLWWNSVSSPFYVTPARKTGPVRYLQCFATPPGVPYFRQTQGRPSPYENAESKNFHEWPYMPLVYFQEMQNYLAICFAEVRSCWDEALRTRGRRREALAAQRVCKETNFEILSMAVVDVMLSEIRELDKRRREVYNEIEVPVLVINRFYDDLAPCENSCFISYVPSLPPNYSPFDLDQFGEPRHCMTYAATQRFLQRLVSRKVDLLELQSFSF